MGDLLIEIIDNCYGSILCTALIACFLIMNRNYGKSLIRLFSLLCTLTLIETIGGTVERYLGEQPTYSSWRLFLSWVCYLTAPALLLTVMQINVRKAKPLVKWLLAIPEFINIIVTSTCFFAAWCFTIDPVTNHFMAGPLSVVPRYTPIVYLVALMVAAIANVRKSKWECSIVFVGVVFIIIDYLNELVFHMPVNLREITVSVMILAYFMYFTAIHHMDEVAEIHTAAAESEERITNEMMDETIETLAYTIDAKDRYTRGHSARVARYSKMIAQVKGKSEAECRQIYLAGLLHDIGKISTSEEIINNPGKLTKEEYEKIMQHPEKGALILEKMKSIPYLLNGAKYHHERYDGTGYPTGLKGDEIPEMARIIAVADAYDAMTSYRSYRNPMERKQVKQELWKGMGTQFDPEFAKIMISLIDADPNYEMKEKPDEPDKLILTEERFEISWNNNTTAGHTDEDGNASDGANGSLADSVQNTAGWCNASDGFRVKNTPTQIRFYGVTRTEDVYVWSAPIAIVYSSDDGTILGPKYVEHGVFMSAGYGWESGDAKYEETSFTKEENFGNWDNWLEQNQAGLWHTISTYREKDVVHIVFENGLLTVNSRLTMPKSYDRPIYVAIAGSRCDISRIREI